MPSLRDGLETHLNDFGAQGRRAALEGLLEEARRGYINLPPQGQFFNLHCHTFFSYNGYGYSPSCLAWKGRLAGLYAMGLVDFDVLDGVDEFLSACEATGLKACAGLETRVFVPAFSTREINSPGEPGVCYHMGMGFTSGQVRDRRLLDELKAIAQRRNRSMVERINRHLDPVQLDYERDVLPLTPNGNATERHVCTAYDLKARALMTDAEQRVAFWADKLRTPPDAVSRCLNDAPVFQGLIRAKTMKAGGPGYVKPEGPDFPRLEQVNAFTLENGAIPTFAWLDGTTAGEQAIEELLDVMVAAGAAAVNIIPDRNWNLKDPVLKKTKSAHLYRFVETAQARHLPILVGTEMNAHGQRFVDDFDAPELKPLLPAFLEGVHILYAHTFLQKEAGMGYLSPWARSQFASVADKNRFFMRLGERLAPAGWPPREP
jgi:hypothetical protein